ncbi:PREDICTED: uncharacterized protein LOC109219077 [Nicotiana attenuata]|uniref:uncharacterized protein LOC109219077 n=1 Tax=Nicotiana attenuata TaxID=49451 RepID=UPI0009056012|nr:PREDICTED: uncharacterized protein LOC109219077 [Nicotiana attenuata]
MDDIKEEVEYWQSTVVCYVLGSNPPLTVIEGYFKRIWGALGIDIFAQTSKGVFLVRFHSVESRTKVVEDGIQTSDRKPVIVKPWRPDVEMNKITVEKVPIWIKLIGLDLKYWGQVALTKIAEFVGKPVKADATITMKERLMYVSVVVEVQPNQTYPDIIIIESETGQVIKQSVEYEWKPIIYEYCKIFGHKKQQCKQQKAE